MEGKSETPSETREICNQCLVICINTEAWYTSVSEAAQAIRPDNPKTGGKGIAKVLSGDRKAYWGLGWKYTIICMIKMRTLVVRYGGRSQPIVCLIALTYQAGPASSLRRVKLWKGLCLRDSHTLQGSEQAISGPLHCVSSLSRRSTWRLGVRQNISQS